MSLTSRFAAANLDWLVANWAAPGTVQGFVTTRHGGDASPGSLDLGPAKLEALDAATRAAIAGNRRFVTRFLPAPPVWLEQVHGNAVATIGANELESMLASPPVADAAVTRLVDVPLAVRIADCLPVLLADDGGNVIAAAHAGWRGLAAGVLEASVAAMAAAPSSLSAWLGPVIGPRAFEVGAEVRDALCDGDHGAGDHFTPLGRGKWLADLAALARRSLRRAGVERIAGDAPCTHSDAARFHSYRRDKSDARMAAFVWRSSAGQS